MMKPKTVIIIINIYVCNKCISCMYIHVNYINYTLGVLHNIIYQCHCKHSDTVLKTIT